MDFSNKTIGARLRDIRIKHNMSQEEVANKISLSTSFYSHIECGSNAPSIQTLINLSKLYGCSCDYLILGTESKETLNEQLAAITNNCSAEQLGAILTMAKLFTNLHNK